MTGSPAVMRPSPQQIPAADGALAVLEADREQLTHLLRGLASKLDGLDRRLADLTWRQLRPQSMARLGESGCERGALEAERARLTDRLAVLAQRLNVLDSKLSGGGGDGLSASLVGTCPYCGYPSLGSGLCAFCRPHLAR